MLLIEFGMAPAQPIGAESAPVIPPAEFFAPVKP
jgi:hypothetical protein